MDYSDYIIEKIIIINEWVDIIIKKEFIAK